MQEAEKVPKYERHISELKEEIESLKIEVEELKKPSSPPPPILADPDVFKQQLAEAVQQLRSEFNRLAAEHRAESDRMYQAKLEQIQNQSDREVQRLAEKLRALQAEADRLRCSIDEAQNEVSKKYQCCAFFYSE